MDILDKDFENHKKREAKKNKGKIVDQQDPNDTGYNLIKGHYNVFLKDFATFVKDKKKN